MATATKKKVETFKIKSPSNFISFLKRFAPIHGNLLLELTPEHMMAKTYTMPDKSVIKYSKIAMADVLEGTTPADLVKIGLHDINKVVHIFKHFDDGAEIFLDVKHDEVGGETIGVELTFRSKNLKVNVGCMDISLFPVYINADSLKKIIKSVADQKVMEFEFPQEAFSKVKNLCSIDSSLDLLRLKIKDNKVYFAGKSFEYELKDVPQCSDIELAFKNEQFGYIDQEPSKIHVGTDKILVKSEASDTLIVIGKTE